MIEGLNLDEDSTDLTDAEVAQAIVTTGAGEFYSALKELAGIQRFTSYALRRRNPHFYCRVCLTDRVTVFQVDWIQGT